MQECFQVSSIFLSGLHHLKFLFYFLHFRFFFSAFIQLNSITESIGIICRYYHMIAIDIDVKVDELNFLNISEPFCSNLICFYFYLIFVKVFTSFVY